MVDLPAAVALAPNPKFWRSLLHRCYDVVDRVNGLLPRAMFVSVVLGLLGHAIPSIRRRAMELLSAKVQHQAQFFALPQDEATLLPLIPALTAIAAGRSPSPQVGRVFPCFFFVCFFLFFSSDSVRNSEESPMVFIKLGISDNKRHTLELGLANTKFMFFKAIAEGPHVFRVSARGPRNVNG